MKYYCPKKWYRNVAGARPCAEDVITDVLLQESAPYHTEEAIQRKWTGGYPARDWRWGLNGTSGDIEFFRVRKRTPQLVENPHVHVHEMLESGEG